MTRSTLCSPSPQESDPPEFGARRDRSHRRPPSPRTRKIRDPTSRKIRDPTRQNSRPLSSPYPQCSEHPARSRSVSSKARHPAGFLSRFCLRRSTLTRRGTPLAPLETWRVASPTPQIKTKAGPIKVYGICATSLNLSIDSLPVIRILRSNSRFNVWTPQKEPNQRKAGTNIPSSWKISADNSRYLARASMPSGPT